MLRQAQHERKIANDLTFSPLVLGVSKDSEMFFLQSNLARFSVSGCSAEVRPEVSTNLQPTLADPTFQRLSAHRLDGPGGLRPW